MMEEAFAVAAEFHFDVGEALINTKSLQGAVDSLSQSANNAFNSLGYLANGLVAHLGFGSGGLLTVLTRSVQISEAFNHSALDFANNISSNIQVLEGTIHSFNDRLATSKMLMDKISETSIKFGVDREGLAQITQLVASPLAARKKLGTNYEHGIEMARNMMIASESVGLPQRAGSEMLARALSPGQSVGGKLFERLLQTPQFRAAHIMHPQQLATMNQDKKIDLLTNALKELGGNAEYLNARLNHLGVQFNILKEQISRVLKPIGDAVVKPIIKILRGLNDYLTQYGKEIGENIGRILGSFLENPKELLVTILQMRTLGNDFKRAANWAPWVMTISFLIHKLGITFGGGLLTKALKNIIYYSYEASSWLFNLALRFGLFSKMLTLLRVLAFDVLAPFAVLLLFFQTISRARALAKVNDAQALLAMTPRLTALFLKLKDGFAMLMTPFKMFIDFWGELLAPIFEQGTYLKILLPLIELFADGVHNLGIGMVVLLAAWSGFTYAVIGFIDDLMHLRNPLKNFSKNFSEEFDDFMNKHMKGQDPTKAVVNQVTNVGKIEARFDMREQLEPDRVAFAVTTHLKKLAINPTQGARQSTGSALVNPSFAGAR